MTTEVPNTDFFKSESPLAKFNRLNNTKILALQQKKIDENNNWIYGRPLDSKTLSSINDQITFLTRINSKPETIKDKKDFAQHIHDIILNNYTNYTFQEFSDNFLQKETKALIESTYNALPDALSDELPNVLFYDIKNKFKEEIHKEPSLMLHV